MKISILWRYCEWFLVPMFLREVSDPIRTLPTSNRSRVGRRSVHLKICRLPTAASASSDIGVSGLAQPLRITTDQGDSSRRIVRA
ncbi:unnamed protein product [Trichogramma brassicae]|uniref:Uncharacterized protein n=1 Tax=Trichogramma brassicae TaxID=86971 RepID=A0A6H5I4L4_9HYME|nr:unnamed protein product [Trichogramma brassicae]